MSRFFSSNKTAKTTRGASEYAAAVEKCILPLDTSTSATIEVLDGRRLGDIEVEGAWLDADAKALGLRIIAIDRPGLGLSTSSPKRTISSHVAEVQQLAEHLGIQRYAVSGASGGGSYALACAALLPPERLKAVTVCCGIGPSDAPKQGMTFANRVVPFVAVHAPSIVRRFYAMQPGGRLDLPMEERSKLARAYHPVLDMNGKDARLYANDDALLLHLVLCQEAFAQGYDGATQDSKLLFDTWDFKLEDVRKDLAIDLWYGQDDEHVPGFHGKLIASRLKGNVNLHMMEDLYLGVIFERRREWLETLARRMRFAA